MTAAVATSADGQWAVVRLGRDVALLGDTTTIELPSDDADIAILPAGLLAVVRTPKPRAILYTLPELQPSAAIELDAPLRLVTVTGQRAVLAHPDHKKFVIVRAAPRALAAHVLDPGGAAEFVVGLDKNQLLLGLAKKLEVWDAVAGRPVLRLQLQLPPPPRAVGAALGHVFATRPGSDEVIVYRLSDGRPFQHHVGSPVERFVSHPASAVVVLVTARGLVRLHCFAHSQGLIDTPYLSGTALALHGTGDDVTLLGVHEANEAWKVGLEPPHVEPTKTIEAVPLPSTTPIVSEPVHVDPQQRIPPGWREPLVTAIPKLLANVAVELPTIADDTELGELATRLALPPQARRALAALYGLYLVGTPSIAIAQLSRILGDWTEALGQGELAALALVHRRAGKVHLRSAVTSLLDGGAPRDIRVAGGTKASGYREPMQLARKGRSDAELEQLLLRELGRIAVITGNAPSALLEARMFETTAVAHAAPAQLPAPWPRDASLVVITDDASPRWATSLAAVDL